MEELDIRDRANRVHYAIRPRCDQALNLANASETLLPYQGIYTHGCQSLPDTPPLGRTLDYHKGNVSILAEQSLAYRSLFKAKGYQAPKGNQESFFVHV